MLMQETTPNSERNEKKKSQLLVGNNCALGLPSKAYQGNKTKGILEKKKVRAETGGLFSFPSPLIVGVDCNVECNIHV